MPADHDPEKLMIILHEERPEPYFVYPDDDIPGAKRDYRRLVVALAVAGVVAVGAAVTLSQKGKRKEFSSVVVSKYKHIVRKFVKKKE